MLNLTAGQTMVRNVVLTTNAQPETTPTPTSTATPTASPTSTSTATPTVPVGPATIVGTIIDVVNRVAVGQAYVCVAGTENCMMSDAFGQYSLGGVTAGALTLRVTRAGYLPYEAALVVGAGQTVAHDVLFMRPPTPTPIPTLRPMPWLTVVVPSGQGIPTFRIMRTEVTNGQYRACVAAGFCTEPGSTLSQYGDPAYDSLPVVWISREQAHVYASWVGGKLPTLPQWVRACQGDDGRTYPWGNAPPDATRANYLWHNEHAGLRLVGSYPAGASPYGALDMAGNVAEWVEWPSAPFVTHGGAYSHETGSLTCTSQRSFGYRSYINVGFRVVFPGP